MTVGRQFIAAIGWSLLVLTLVLALVLLVRRLVGAFDRPLGGWVIVAVALALEVVALLIRRSVLSTKYSVLSTQYAVLRTESPYGFGIVSSFVIVVLASLTLPGTPAVGVALAWILLIAGEAAQGLFYSRPDVRRVWNTRSANPIVSPLISEAAELEIPAGLVQQLTRVREGDRESLHALVRAEIPGGDRLAVLHLSFCPPLGEAPELRAHAVEAEDAEVRVTLAETFGARIEVRLPREDAAARSVLVEVLGTVTARSGV
jgi:hypothetical protein